VADYGTSRAGLERVGWDEAGALVDDISATLGSLSADPVHDIGSLAASGLQMMKRDVQRRAALIPRSTDRYTITAFGQPGTTRQKLANVCYKVLANYIGTADALFASTRTHLTVDLMGKWVRLA